MTGAMRVTTVALAAIVGALAACQAPMATYESTDPIRHSSEHGDGGTTEGGPTAPGSETNGQPSIEQADAAPPEPTDWVGGVPFTSFSPFGPSACRYEARYENVTVTVRITADHKLAAATIGAKDVERISDGCAAKPTPRTSKDHVWTYVAANASDPKVTVNSAEGDDPRTELSIEIGVDSETQAWATLTWKRTDQQDPWQWTIGPQYVPLGKK